MLHVEFYDLGDLEVDWASLQDECLSVLAATGFDYTDPYISNSETLAIDVCYALQAATTNDAYLRLYGDEEYETMVRFLYTLEAACEANQGTHVIIDKEEEG